MLQAIKRFNYSLTKRLLRWLLRPAVAQTNSFEGECVYVLENRSMSDLIVLDLIAEETNNPSPLETVQSPKSDTSESKSKQRRIFFLNRGHGFIIRRNTMKTISPGLTRLQRQAFACPEQDITLVPVSVFWGRAPARKHSFFRSILSEHWTVTSRLKRFVGCFLNRKDIVVYFGQPLSLQAVNASTSTPDRLTRRIARLLRVRFRNQRVGVMGPDFSHQRTLINQIVNSRAVSQVIEQGENEKAVKKSRKKAEKHAKSIASDMSYTTVRLFERGLTWFWHKIYEGIDVGGLEKVRKLAETNTIVYVPSHRSHLDYLLLSYLLHENNIMIPHIAAGDNLNLPIIGGFLRRCGAFFMRRSFREDPLYAAVFSEYLYQVYRRGHSVEFFIEGGRTRTGRLRSAKLGMLRMTIEHHRRGLPRPITFVPVYFGYEKLIEARSYLDELQGVSKKGESVSDIFTGLRLIRQDFGRVTVNFGEPLNLAETIDHAASVPANELASTLGRELLRRINSVAHVNPVNLVALVTLGTPKLAIDESQLTTQIECYQRLINAEHTASQIRCSPLPANEIVNYVERLGMLEREQQSYGAVIAHDPVSAVLMTWYRNNVLHVLAMPSLIACLLSNQRRGLRLGVLKYMVDLIYPYFAIELNQDTDDSQAFARWLGHLQNEKLIKLSSDGQLMPATADSEAFTRLKLLSQIVKPTLERLYIVVGTLHRSPNGTFTRKELEKECHQVAKRLSRLYGLNAPEFFDASLFHQFVTALADTGLIFDGGCDSSSKRGCESGSTDEFERESTKLEKSEMIERINRSSSWVIDSDFRHAVLYDSPSQSVAY